MRSSHCGHYLVGWDFPATMQGVRECRSLKKLSTHTFESLWSAFGWLGFPCYNAKREGVPIT
jgi:hypothetical protein